MQRNGTAQRSLEVLITRMSVKRKLFVTGATGMVGRNILEHPMTADWDVLSPPRAELDLTDVAALEDWMNRYRPDAVIHAAGRVGGIQANSSRPADFLVTNVDLGRNVVLMAQKAGVTQLLNLASSCIYPKKAGNPLTEEMILTGELEPTNEGYAIAKIFVTRLCQYICRAHPRLQYKTLIPCNLYGRYDKFSPECSHLIPGVIDKIHKAKSEGKSTVNIWGDGTARREFMYAGDMADAALNALEDLSVVPELMNIGVGYDHTINEYYRIVADIVGWKGKFLHDFRQPVGVSQKLVSIERQSRWGWVASTSLKKGIRDVYEYYLTTSPS